VLHSERFCDAAPSEVYATLLDEGTYLCSERTMYRVLAAEGETRERRAQLTHPVYHKPELLAEAPNELWSWDITKLLVPAKWTYFYLYVILDVFSRYVVGWMVAHRESAELAQRLIAETAAKQQIPPGQLTLHADRGTSMTSRPVAFLLADLGITKSHSLPHVSNDSPSSESQFKTLKYRPAFPDRFLSMEAARGFCGTFFPWYNTEHHHSGIGFLTPEALHTGRAPALHDVRSEPLAIALRAAPRAIRPQGTSATTATDGGLDQQARPWSGGNSLIFQPSCLKTVDRFRCASLPLSYTEDGRGSSRKRTLHPVAIGGAPARPLAAAPSVVAPRSSRYVYGNE
jgi:putative transposase